MGHQASHHRKRSSGGVSADSRSPAHLILCAVVQCSSYPKRPSLTVQGHAARIDLPVASITINVATALHFMMIYLKLMKRIVLELQRLRGKGLCKRCWRLERKGDEFVEPSAETVACPSPSPKVEGIKGTVQHEGCK